MSINITIFKNWIKKKYWEEELTDYQMAKVRNVSVEKIRTLIREYDLQKKKNGIKGKGKKGYVMPEAEKEKHRTQPNAKEVIVYKGKNNTKVGIYRSITHAANELGIRREHIRDCLKENKQRKTAFGYSFGYKKYKGEIIIERRRNLDFTLEFHKVCEGLHRGLPSYPYQERINHYNKKLSNIWKDLGNASSTK